MNHFLDDQQIEELNAFDFFDDEETKREINDFYDDLSEGLPLNINYDF